jgi:hypothetical protein
MSWSPNDLVTDLDLEAYESSIRRDFGSLSFTEKRQAALEHWLWPRLSQAKFPAERFRTRYQPDAVYTSISGAFADETGDAKSQTVDDLNLAATFATVGTDALYIGSTRMFRGLSVRLSDAVSAVTSTLTVQLWTDSWESVGITDGTVKVAGKTFSGGGAITWRVPAGDVSHALSDHARGADAAGRAVDAQGGVVRGAGGSHAGPRDPQPGRRVRHADRGRRDQ